MATQITENQAESLNNEWDLLASRFDQYYTDLSPEVSDQIQRAINEWQDWFYGNYGVWGNSGELDKWKSLLVKANKLLEEAVAQGIKAKTPVDLEPEEEPTELPPLMVYGRVPKEPTIYDPEAEEIDYEIPEYKELKIKEDSNNVLPWIFGGILTALALKQLTK